MTTTALLKDDNNNTQCELQSRPRHLCHPQARRFQEISSGSSIDLELLVLRGLPLCAGASAMHGDTGSFTSSNQRKQF